MSKRAPGMIFIASESMAMRVACEKKVLKETALLKEDKEAKPMLMDVRSAEYDGVRFHFKSEGETFRKVKVSIEGDCVGDLVKYGGQSMLDDTYDKYDTDVSDNKVTISFDADNLPEDPEAVCAKIALLKHNLFGAPFDQCFDAIKNGRDLGGITYEYRKDASIFLAPGDKQVSVVYQMFFEDGTDKELAKILLQEFTEVQRTVNGAPNAQFFEGKAPPVAKDIRKDIPNEKSSFFLMLTINEGHLKTDVQQENVTALLINIRTYFLYHMKCTKAYMLSRMRSKYQDLLKTLARAKPKNRQDGGVAKKSKEAK